MPKYLTIGYGDQAGYDQTAPSLRDAAHRHDAAEIADRLQWRPCLAIVFGDRHPNWIKPREHDQPFAVCGEREAKVAEVGSDDVLNVRQMR